jgi:hypothetical protein
MLTLAANLSSRKLQNYTRRSDIGTGSSRPDLTSVLLMALAHAPAHGKLLQDRAGAGPRVSAIFRSRGYKNSSWKRYMQLQGETGQIVQHLALQKGRATDARQDCCASASDMRSYMYARCSQWWRTQARHAVLSLVFSSSDWTPSAYREIALRLWWRCYTLAGVHLRPLRLCWDLEIRNRDGRSGSQPVRESRHDAFVTTCRVYVPCSYPSTRGWRQLLLEDAARACFVAFLG